jgi:hypothetical protein
MTVDSDIRGIWTYRSFRNTAGPVDSFDKLEVWQAELYLEIEEGSRLHGHLGERPAEATGSEPYLTVVGELTKGEPAIIKWRARGKSKSEYDGWIYDYIGYLAPSWSDSRTQRPAIVGTVTRTVPHGTAPAGSVFSFVAVKSDFAEPRTTIPVAKPVVDMMAAAEHRYLHALWHASRDEWYNRNRESPELSVAKKDALRVLGWQPGPNGHERASGSPDRFSNGSGEDFFFMHRRMVQTVRSLDPAVGTWRRLPQPIPLSDFSKGFKVEMVGNPDGFAIPPSWTIEDDVGTTGWLATLRTISTLYSKFQIWEQQYADQNYLATLTLGELGSRIEFTIHNWMHMRWASVPRDPSADPAKRGQPIPSGRDALDFDPKWLDPMYDYLGETFSSHVNPVFWRIHGWVDDRVEDWFKAQETVRPGVVKRKQVLGVDWFEADGRWVIVQEPWEGLRVSHAEAADGHEHANHDGHDHGHSDLQLDVPTMQSALQIIFGPEPVAKPMTAVEERSPNASIRMGTWFKRIDS